MRKFVSPAPVLTTARDTTEVRKGFSEVSKWSADVLHNGDKFDAATVGGLDVADIAEMSKDPTGFTDPENVAVSFDSTTTKVSLSGSVKAYWHGGVVKALVNGWTSPALSASYTTPNTGYFLYYDGSDFLWSATPWTFDLLQIAYVYYSAAGSYLFATHETHGLMPWSVHEITHRLLGTYKLSGGVVSGVVLASTTAADRRPLLTATVLMDEDCKTTAAALASASYTREYLAGAGAVNTWAAASGDIVALSGNQPYWNEYTGGAWQQTLMANNSYMSIWVLAVPVASDTGSQAYRYLFIQGQSNGTLSSEQSKTPQNVNLGALATIAPEFVFFKRLILLYTAANWTVEQVDDLIGTKSYSTSPSISAYIPSFSCDTLTANLGIYPDVPDGATLGSAALPWSDLHLAEGGVINWDNGDVTLTQVGNVLTFGGSNLIRFQYLTDSLTYAIRCFSETESHRGYLDFYKSRSNAGANGATVTADTLGDIRFYGNSGTAFTLGAEIRATQNGAAGAGTPTYLYFATHDGTNAIASMQLTVSGYVLAYVGFTALNSADPGAPANRIYIHSRDSSVGAANATLALRTEQAVEAIGTFTASHKLRVWINNVEYWIQLDAV